MSKIRSAWVAPVLGALLLSACATPPPPPPKQAKTTVILMPDEEGNVGAVSVTSDAGTQQVNQAFAYTVVTGRAKPTDASALGEDATAKNYAGLLDAQPPKPKSFMLHFLLDKTALTEESKAQLPALYKAVAERKPTEITIFGHTDAIGSEKHNFKLSADRARAIAALLKKNDPTLDHIDVQYFGEKAPWIQGDGRKAEPRNRRAEIMIL